MSERTHRIREVYDSYRTSLLNAKYYGCKLARYRRINFILEATIACGATGSGIAGWQLWESPGWKSVYLAIAAFASLLAIIKPLIQLNKQIETYSKLFGAHTSNTLALKRVVVEIADTQNLTDETLRTYNVIYDKIIELAALDDPQPSKRLLSRFENDVNQEVPVDSLWWPKDSKSEIPIPTSTSK